MFHERLENLKEDTLDTTPPIQNNILPFPFQNISPPSTTTTIQPAPQQPQQYFPPQTQQPINEYDENEYMDENIDRCNLFVKHLPTDMNQVELKRLFSNIGIILETKIMIDPNTGISEGYGFVRFLNSDDCFNGKMKMNGYPIRNKKLYCTYAHKVHLNERRNNQVLCTNLYVTHLPGMFDEVEFYNMFSKYGQILQMKLWRDKDTGRSKRMGFIRYKKQKDATMALEKMNGVIVDNSRISVKYANEKRNNQTQNSLFNKKRTIIEQNEQSSVYMEMPINRTVSPILSPNSPLNPEFISKSSSTTSSSSSSSSKKEDNNNEESEKDVKSSSYRNNLDELSPLTPFFLTNMMGKKPFVQPPRDTDSPLNPSFVSPRSTIEKETPLKPAFAFGNEGLSSSAPTEPRSLYSPYSSPRERPFSRVIEKSNSTPLRPDFAGFYTNFAPHNSESSSSNERIQKKKEKNSDSTPSLFIFHLPEDIDNEKLKRLFSPFGHVKSANVIFDKKTRLSRGYGFVQYYNFQDAIKGMSKMNGYKIGRKRLKVSFKTKK